MPDTDIEFAYTVAERLRKSVEDDRLRYQPRCRGKLNITISIGIAVGRRRRYGRSLLHRADQALYRAKREGRNRVVADAGLALHSS